MKQTTSKISEYNLLSTSLAKNRYQKHRYLSAKTRFLASNSIAHVFSITAMISIGRSIFPSVSCLPFRHRSPQNFSQNPLVDARVICIRLILINVAAPSSGAHLRSWTGIRLNDEHLPRPWWIVTSWRNLSSPRRIRHSRIDLIKRTHVRTVGRMRTDWIAVCRFASTAYSNCVTLYGYRIMSQIK